MNAIGTPLRDLIHSGLPRWCMAVLRLDAAAKVGKNSVSKHQIQPEYDMEMSRLTRGTGRLNLSRETKFSGMHGDREY